MSSTRSADKPLEPVRIAMIEALSGPFANAGEAVFRNLVWAVERVNARGGVALPEGRRKLELLRYDSKGTPEEAVSMLRSALDNRIGFVMQGNSSAAAAALVDALDKHNAREPDRRAVFLNYSAVEPSLTNEKCSFWHFRFDAHADMRLNALVDVLRDDAAVKKVYLIGQDYSFGQHVVRKAREVIAAKRPDIEIVGEELHPMGRVKDFLPYASKIRSSGAQAVVTGNWGNDLTLLVKAAKDIGLPVKFYTFYGNALGVPSALGDAGVGSVLAVAEWHPNVGGEASDAFYAAFRQRFPDPAHDYVHVRMQVMVEMLVSAMERARSADPMFTARALEGLRFDGGALGGVHAGTLRAGDHQFQQPLVVSVMERAGAAGTRHDVEGTGYGFRTVRRLAPEQVEMPHSCRMVRPD
jgi:branched-chain amino acid transport system substrate-binding protein